MSTENLNEVLCDQNHTDDVLDHIDDESQQEYIEKIAPKAQEEILTINQDCDSSPTNELHAESFDENDKEFYVEKEISEFHEVLSLNENDDNLKEVDIKQKEIDIDEPIQNEIEFNIIDETKVIENSVECQLKEEVETDLFQVNEKASEEHESTIEIIQEPEIVSETSENCEQVEKSELEENLVIEKNVAENQITEMIKEKPVNFELKENVSKSIVKDGNESSQEYKDESIDDIQNVEDISCNFAQDEQFESSHEKKEVLNNKKMKDVKALTSSYSNDDNVNSVCEICKKTVYPLEKLSANNRIFHKLCFKCTKCRCALLAANFSFNNDKPYCRPHYIELFKKRGRYDEIDDGEITQQTTINDILTDELPAADITKNLVAKFRGLESGAGTVASSHTSNSDGTDGLPAPNTTKNLMERFSALGKDNDREPKRKPMIEIPRSSENGHSSGECENQPITLPKDVARANEPGHDEMPEQGITKNLVNRFRDLESTGVASK